MKVEYYNHYGNDNMVVDMARASFAKRSENYTPEQNARLIAYLARENHFMPFAHPRVTLHIEAPIFVARQDFKHQVGFERSEESRRYVDDEPEFYTPDAWRKRAENKKQGSSDETTGEWGFGLYEGLIKHAESVYSDMLEYGVCPEQARMVLPQSMMTSYYVTGSLAAWARAYKLRIDEHAQKEIRDLASQWGETIEPLFPVSWKELTK